jgi:hypothetical protein
MSETIEIKTDENQDTSPTDAANPHNVIEPTLDERHTTVNRTPSLRVQHQSQQSKERAAAERGRGEEAQDL